MQLDAILHMVGDLLGADMALICIHRLAQVPAKSSVR